MIVGLREIVESKLKDMPPGLHAVARLLVDHSVAEVAARMKISRNAVMKRRERAERLLGVEFPRTKAHSCGNCGDDGHHASTCPKLFDAEDDIGMEASDADMQMRAHGGCIICGLHDLEIDGKKERHVCLDGRGNEVATARKEWLY